MHSSEVQVSTLKEVHRVHMSMRSESIMCRVGKPHCAKSGVFADQGELTLRK